MERLASLDAGFLTLESARVYTHIGSIMVLDAGSGGPENDFTNRNTTFMTWNLMHLARLLKQHGGIPAHGNQRRVWDAGCRFDFENPEYR